MAEQGKRLDQQLHAGGLAVGAGDADHPHRLAGTVVEACGDFADLAVQAVDPQQRHVVDRLRQIFLPALPYTFPCQQEQRLFRTRRFGQHDLGTALHRAGGELDAVALGAAQGEERVAALHPARIERQPGHHDAADARHGGDLRIGDAQQQLVEVAGAHGVSSSTGASSIGASAGGLLPTSPSTFCNGPPTYQRPMLSGGTSSSRSAPSITLAKTGPDTVPP